MAAGDRLTNIAPAREFSRGSIGPCTPNDRAALCELYRAVYPNVTEAALADDVKEQESESWASYRDERGVIRIAMFLVDNGTAWLFARPSDCDSPEIKRGLLVLAEDVHRMFRQRGIESLALVHASSLDRLGASLEREGLVSKVFNVARTVCFSDKGKVARTN